MQKDTKKWLWASFDSPGDVLDFLNKHNLKPGDILVVNTKTAYPYMHVLYYAERALEK